MRRYYFHASPTSNRQRILEEGLTGHLQRRMWTIRCHQRGQPTGNYFYGDVYGCRGYADHLHSSQHHLSEEFGSRELNCIDIWKADLVGLSVQPDPENVHKYGELSLEEAQEQSKWGDTVAPRWWLPEWVSPQRLEVIETYDWNATPYLAIDASNAEQMPEALTRVPGYVWSPSKRRFRRLGF